MLDFTVADGLLLLGMPVVSAILVALVFVLVARTRVDTPLSPSLTLHMNDDGSLSEAVDAECEHALAA